MANLASPVTREARLRYRPTATGTKPSLMYSNVVAKYDECLVEANSEYLQKLKIFFIINVLSLGCLLLLDFAMPEILTPIARALSVIPTIARMRGSSEIGPAATGLTLVLAPVLAIALLHGDPTILRIRRGLKKYPGIVKSVLFLYLIALPTLCALIWLVYATPASVFVGKASTGGSIAAQSLASSSGLAIAALPVVGAGLGIMIWCLLVLILGPILILFGKRHAN